MTQVTTSATYKTLVTADLPDFGSRDITFRLVAAFFNAANEEVIDGTTYTMTLDASGVDDGSFYLPTPDNTGAAGANWFVTLPSGYEDVVTVAYSGTAQAVSDLLAAGSTTTDPDVIVAAIASKATKVSGATADNLASLTSGGDLADSGAAAANVPTDDEKSWLTAGEAGGSLGTAAYAATGDFDAAGSAAAAQAASQPLDADLTAIAGLSSADGNFIVGSATGWVAESGATARTSLGLGTIATAAAGDYHLTTAFSAAPTAAEPLKADGSGGVVGKSLNLNGITVSDFTTLFPGKSATLFGIFQSSSVATGGISANGFTNTTATGIPVIFTAYHGSTSPTVPSIIFRAAKHNGTTSAVALAFAESIFQIRNWTSNVMTVLGSGAVGLRTDTPAAQLHIVPNGAAALGLIIQMPTSATGNSFEVRDVSGNTLGQIGPAGNMALGQQSTASHEISGRLKSSTTANTQAARIAWAWTVATHASRTATLTLYASDYGGERTGLQIGANGTEPTIGFYGATPVARQLLATGTGATVDNVITALQNLGLLRQS